MWLETPGGVQWAPAAPYARPRPAAQHSSRTHRVQCQRLAARGCGACRMAMERESFWKAPPGVYCLFLFISAALQKEQFYAKWPESFLEQPKVTVRLSPRHRRGREKLTYSICDRFTSTMCLRSHQYILRMYNPQSAASQLTPDDMQQFNASRSEQPPQNCETKSALGSLAFKKDPRIEESGTPGRFPHSLAWTQSHAPMLFLSEQIPKKEMPHRWEDTGGQVKVTLNFKKAKL